MNAVKLETPTTAWDAFAKLQDSRGKNPAVPRELIAKIVVDQERLVRRLRAEGIKVEEVA